MTPSFPNLPTMSLSHRETLIEALTFVNCDRAQALLDIAEMSEEEAYEHIFCYTDMLESQFDDDNVLMEDFN